MEIRKWNAKAHEYEPCEIPDSWTISCLETDMEKLVNCAGCGEKIAFGNSYTSRVLHTALGFGYAVCKKCYEHELEGEQA